MQFKKKTTNIIEMRNKIKKSKTKIILLLDALKINQ